MTELYDHVWCLVCDQQPAAGTLCRVTANGAKTTLEDDESIPHVCTPCGRSINHAEGKPFHGFSTVWRFLRYPA